MNIKRISNPTSPLTHFVETSPEVDIACGSVAMKMKYYNIHVGYSLGFENTGASVLGSLNLNETHKVVNLLKRFVKPEQIIPMNLGRGSSAVGGGKSYEEMLKNRWYYKEKINKAIQPVESLVNNYGCKVQRNDYGTGSHGIVQAELNKKLDYLDLPYKINIIGYPQDEYSEQNLPELLSYLCRQKNYQNILYNNPSSRGLVDYVGAILSHTIIGRTTSGITDGIDISDMWRDLKNSRMWTLTSYVSTDPRYKTFDWIPFWTKPQVDRQVDTLARVVKRTRPTKQDIILVAGDFTRETIQSIKSIINQECHVKPRIRHLLCKTLPTGINCIVGKLSPCKFMPVATPHFDEMEYLIESDP